MLWWAALHSYLLYCCWQNTMSPLSLSDDAAQGLWVHEKTEFCARVCDVITDSVTSQSKQQQQQQQRQCWWLIESPSSAQLSSAGPAGLVAAWRRAVLVKWLIARADIEHTSISVSVSPSQWRRHWSMLTHSDMHHDESSTSSHSDAQSTAVYQSSLHGYTDCM